MKSSRLKIYVLISVAVLLLIFRDSVRDYVAGRSGLVGKVAPAFLCDVVFDGTIKQNFSLEDLRGFYKLLFFYPADFTYVCPTELHALQEALPEFERRNVAIVAISTNTAQDHLRWVQTPKHEGGIEGITFPLVADCAKKMAKKYGVLSSKNGVALRAAFILDQHNIVQACQIYNLPMGRNIQELLRVIDALQFSELHGQVCPANWELGKKALYPTHESVVDYLNNPSAIK